MAKKKKADPASADEPAFEDAMQELEAIVGRLEQGGGALEEALEDYARAIGLMKACHQKLEGVERRVEILSGVDREGNPISEKMQESDESLEKKRTSRSAKRTAKSDDDSAGLF